MNMIQQLQAGVRVPQNESGRFLRILASEFQDKIKIQFYRSGALITEVDQVGRGYSESMEDGAFDSWAVTSSVTQNVNIVTRVGSKNSYDTPPVGDVSIVGSVTIGNPDAQKRYDTYGASWKSNATLTANVPETIVSPAANTNGLILWVATFCERQTTTSNISAMLAKSSAPVNVYDGDVVVASTAMMAMGGLNITLNEGRLLRPILIPPGKGLYYVTSGVQDGASLGRSVLYTLL